MVQICQGKPHNNCNDKKPDEYLSKKDEQIEEKLKENNIEDSGYYGHDEAFLRINGKKYSFLSMIDSTNQKIINDQLIPEDEYRQFLETFHNILTKRFIRIF